MMLTLAMVLSVCAFTVSADRIERTPIAAEDETIITLWDGEHWAYSSTTAEKGSNSVFFESHLKTSPIGVPMILAGATTKGSTVSSVNDPLDENNKVFEVKSDLIQINYRRVFNNPLKDHMGDNNVLSFSSRLMVPSTQPEGVVKTGVVRKWELPFSVKECTGDSDKDIVSTKFSPNVTVTMQYNAAGQLEVSAKVEGTHSKKRITDSVIVPEDQYFTVRTDYYVEPGVVAMYLVYVNDQLVYSGNSQDIYPASTVNAETGDPVHCGLYLGDFKYTQTDMNAVTYIDETKFTASEKLNSVPVLGIGTTKQTADIAAEPDKSATLLENVGFFSKSFLQSSGTNVATTYSRDTETVSGETLININTSGKGTTRVLSLVREPVDDIPYMSLIGETDPLYIVSSMELYIPAGTEAIKREIYFGNSSRVRGEGQTDDTVFKTSSINYYATVQNGKINFRPSLGESVKKKNFVEKFEEVTFPSDKLVNIKMVHEVTGTEATGYNVKFYGIVDDNVTYVSEYTYPAGEFGLSQFNLDIVNATKNAVNTKIDDINISLHTDYTIPAKTWNLVNYAYPAVVTANGNTVNAKGLIVNSSTDKLDAVVAFYDVNGKLIAPLAKTTLTKSGNDFSIEANAEIPEGAATAKVFFFDSLATAKPVMKSAKITIE